MTDNQTTSLKERAERERDAWRATNAVADWEAAEIGTLLDDHDPRDLALMVVRLRAALKHD